MLHCYSTHLHTLYAYIYIHRERERERAREYACAKNRHTCVSCGCNYIPKLYIYNIENAINHIAHVLSVCSNSAQSPDILYIAGSTPLSQIVWPGAAPCCVRV